MLTAAAATDMYAFHRCSAAVPVTSPGTIKAVDDEYKLEWRPNQDANYQARLRVLANDIGQNLVITGYGTTAPLRGDIYVSRDQQMIIYR